MSEEDSGKSVPAETRHANADKEYHDKFRANGDLREPYRIANHLLVGTQPVPLPKAPETPTIVFINSRSGGRAGPDLAIALRHGLGYSQVYDLDGTNRPDKVLEVLRRNFESDGSELASHTRARLRIIAAGGDGTVAWILQVIKRLKLQPPPPVAVIPLGTGNDLSRQFGWGGAFKGGWIKNHKSIYETLKRVADAQPEDLDCWEVKMTAPDKSFFGGSMPYAFEHDAGDPKPFSCTAYSWNYVSIGMDAKAAYGFHHLRNTKPQLAFSRAVNQFWYGYYGCSSGWFCCSKDLKIKVPELWVSDKQGNWTQVPVDPRVKALVVLNLQSYGAGRNLWGKKKDERFATPAANDGMVEVVGLGNGWHTGLVMAGLTHGFRIAQGHGVKIKVCGWRDTENATSKIHLQLDGEPWKQKVPNLLPKKAQEFLGVQEYLEIVIKHANTSKVLHHYKSKAGAKAGLQSQPGSYLFQPVTHPLPKAEEEASVDVKGFDEGVPPPEPAPAAHAPPAPAPAPVSLETIPADNKPVAASASNPAPAPNPPADQPVAASATDSAPAPTPPGDQPVAASASDPAPAAYLVT